jgi:hypothetical protein
MLFFHRYETIKHPFFEYKFPRATWSIILVASNLYQPLVPLICLITDYGPFGVNFKGMSLLEQQTYVRLCGITEMMFH